jgi:hypothetical protein
MSAQMNGAAMFGYVIHVVVASLADTTPTVVIGGLAIPVTGAVIYAVMRAGQQAVNSAPQTFEAVKEFFRLTPATELKPTYVVSPSTAAKLAELPVPTTSSSTVKPAGAEPYVFISYHHRDEAAAKAVESLLRTRGIKTWRDDQLTPGSIWRKALQEAIEEASAVLVLMSGDDPSEEVIGELEWAKRTKRYILPISIADGMYFSVAGLQYAKLEAGRISEAALTALKAKL